MKRAEASIRKHLQSLPIDQRAEFLADMFRIIAGEFAALVLEHTKPQAGKPVARARKRRVEK